MTNRAVYTMSAAILAVAFAILIHAWVVWWIERQYMPIDEEHGMPEMDVDAEVPA